mgnify:CR=1 FL=1
MGRTSPFAANTRCLGASCRQVFWLPPWIRSAFPSRPAFTELLDSGVILNAPLQNKLGLQRRVRSGFAPDSLFVSTMENRHVLRFRNQERGRSQMPKKQPNRCSDAQHLQALQRMQPEDMPNRQTGLKARLCSSMVLWESLSRDEAEKLVPKARTMATNSKRGFYTSISPRKYVTAWPLILTRSPSSRQNSSPPRAESCRACRSFFFRRLDQ